MLFLWLCCGQMITLHRGIESCGILAGRLSASDSRFTVTTLIVPKQTGEAVTDEQTVLARLQRSLLGIVSVVSQA